MRNLNEPLRKSSDVQQTEDEQIKTDPPNESRVVSMEDRQRKRAEAPQSLISDRESENLRARWAAIQTSFVDEPRRAVKDADELVSSAIKQLSENFHNRRAGLEKQWSTGSQVSTEDLRLSLQQYRTFFDRLLSM